MGQLLQGKVTAATYALVGYVVVGGRARDFVGTLDWLVEQTARARGRRIARVRAAAEIEVAQRSGLSDTLSSLVGSPVELQIVLDPTLLSGAVIQIGDLQVDASARGRIDALREHLVPGGWEDARVGARANRRWINDRRSRPTAELTIDASDITAALSSATSRTTRRRSVPSRSGASSRSVTASPSSRACRAPRSTSCWSSRTARSAWR